jgi:succinate dehydrogenase / fumarate reductase cytochrome b subunit
MSAAPKPRPKYYDLNLAHLPPPGLVSILHRVSGIVLFFPILPLLLYMLHTGLGSEQGFTMWRDFFSRPPVKLVMIGVFWAYAHHFWAGLRYLLLDLHIGIDKAPSRTSAYVVLVLGVLTALSVGWRVW